MAPDRDVLGIFRKMATLREIKARSEDLLSPLFTLTLGLYVRFRPIRLCVIYVFCQYFFGTVLSFSRILIQFDQKTLLAYGSYSGIQIFVLFNLGPLILVADSIHQLLKNYGNAVLPIEILKETTLKGVLFSIKLIKFVSAINITMAFIAALGFIWAPAYFDEKTYLCVWIRENFPGYSYFLTSIVHWTSLPVAFILAGSPIGWAYGSYTVLIQIQMIHELIDGISDSTIPQKLRRDSLLYQEVVKQKMIIAIMVHEYTVRFQEVATEILEVPLMTLSMGSLVLGGAVMMEFLTNQTDSEQSINEWPMYVGIFCLTTAGILSSYMYMVIGQSLKDESEKCNYHLSQLPWYDMNEDNKRIYSIFLYRSFRNLALSNSLVQLDYGLLVKILKSLYSLAAVLAQFVSTNVEVV